MEEEERVVKGDDVIVDLDATLEDLYMGGTLKVLNVETTIYTYTSVQIYFAIYEEMMNIMSINLQNRIFYRLIGCCIVIPFLIIFELWICKFACSCGCTNLQYI